MSKAFIRSIDASIKRITNVLDRIDSSDRESMDDLDSVINTLYGLREEELERARFDANFLENPLDEGDELDREEER